MRVSDLVLLVSQEAEPVTKTWAQTISLGCSPRKWVWECEGNERDVNTGTLKLVKVPPVGTLLASPRSTQNTSLNPSPKDRYLEHYQLTPSSPLVASCWWGRGGVGRGVTSQALVSRPSENRRPRDPETQKTQGQKVDMLYGWCLRWVCQNQVSLISKGIVCHNRVCKALYHKQDHWRCFNTISKIKP